VSRSLRAQTPPGRNPTPLRIERLTPESAAGRILPGQSGVEAPPGLHSRRSARAYAEPLGRKLGHVDAAHYSDRL
jgi:hypothetical protein